MQSDPVKTLLHLYGILLMANFASLNSQDIIDPGCYERVFGQRN